MKLILPENSRLSSLDRATIAVTVAACCVQSLFAGTEGTWSDPTGRGVMANNVVFGTSKKEAISGVGANPSSEVSYVQTYYFEGTSWTRPPFRTPTSVYCRGQILPNFLIKVEASVTAGVTADNQFLQEKFNVRPVECAELTFSSAANYFDGFSGEIVCDTKASDGTALGVVIYELDQDHPAETKEEVLAQGNKLAEVFLKGPFDFSDNGDPTQCKALRIPFRTENGVQHLYVMVDTLLLSKPLKVNTPDDIEIACGTAISYPLPQVLGACEQPFFVNYHPPESELGPGRTTVRGVITDLPEDPEHFVAFDDLKDASDELVDYFEFDVTVFSDFVGFDSPLSGSSLSGTGGSFMKPARRLNIGRDIPVKFSENCNGLPVFEPTGPVVQVHRVTNNGTPEGDIVYPPVISKGSALLNETSNVYHVNVDTSTLTPGVYLITATLADGRLPGIYVELR